MERDHNENFANEVWETGENEPNLEYMYFLSGPKQVFLDHDRADGYLNGGYRGFIRSPGGKTERISAAIRWLEQLGDPYVLNVVDADGRLGIDLGVYGAPESFLLDAEGIIRYKRVGEVNAFIWASEIEPLVEQLTRQSEG